MLFWMTGLIFFAAGFIQGLTGFGSALVAIPLLALIMDIKQAVPLCVLNGLAITSYLAIRLRRHIDPGKIVPLICASFPGILVGTVLLKRLPSSALRLAVGLLLSGYACYCLLVRPRPLHPGKVWAWIAGFCTGAIGSALSAGGPPVIIYTALTGWSKDEIKATLTGLFMFNGVTIAFFHALSGVSSRGTVALFAGTLPFVLAGTVCGALLGGRIDRTTYLRLVYILLLCMGIMMIAG